MNRTQSTRVLIAALVFCVTPLLHSGDTPNDIRKTSEYTIGPSVQPLIIIGEGWTQQFIFINVDYYSPTEPTVGTFRFYSQDGKAWKVPLRNLGLTDHVDINLRPGQMLMLETEVLWSYPQLGWGHFELSSSTSEWGIYHAFTVYRKQTEGRPDLMTSVPFVDGLEDEWIIPFDNDGWKYPGIALVNTGASGTITFFLDVISVDGSRIKTLAKTVPPRNLHWFSLIGENPDLTGKRGQIKVSGGLFRSAVFTLQFAPNGAFTALPVVHTYGMN